MHKYVKDFITQELKKSRASLFYSSLYKKGWRIGKSFYAEKTIARCNCNTKRLEFSEYWFDDINQACMKEIVWHEIAHALDSEFRLRKYKPHNKKWKMIARSLGCVYSATIPIDKSDTGKTIFIDCP